MKRICSFLLCVWLGSSLWAEGQTVVVDLNEVFKQYEPSQRADAQLQEKLKAHQQEMQSGVEALRAMQEQFAGIRSQAGDLSMDENQRQELAAEATGVLEKIQAKEAELNQLQQTFQKDLQQQAQREKARLFNEMMDGIQAMSKERNWGLVLNLSAQDRGGVPTVLFASTEKNVTLDVIRYLNRDDEAETEAVETE